MFSNSPTTCLAAVARMARRRRERNNDEACEQAGVAHARQVVVIALLVFGNYNNSVREKDWCCSVRVTPVRSPWRAHIACVPRLRQRQFFCAHAYTLRLQF